MYGISDSPHLLYPPDSQEVYIGALVPPTDLTKFSRAPSIGYFLFGKSHLVARVRSLRMWYDDRAFVHVENTELKYFHPEWQRLNCQSSILMDRILTRHIYMCGTATL